MNRRQRSLLLAIVSAASLTFPTAVAAEAPSPAAARTQVGDDWAWTPTTAGWALPISYLGWGAISFRHDEPIAVIELPNSRGHRLRQVEFTVDVPDFIDGVLLDVSVDGRSIHAEHYPSGRTDVVLALRGPSTDLTFEATPSLSGCPVTDQPYVAHLRDAMLFYDTDVDATTRQRGSLLRPDVVTQTTFVVEPGRSRYTDGAVLDAAAALSSGFAGQQRVAVTSADQPVDDPGPFGLVVTVGERERTEISAVGAATLRITGRGEDLVTQARGLTEALTALSTARSFIVERVDLTTAPDPGRPVTVGDLPGARLSEAGGRQLEVVVPLAQTTFGGPVSSYTARLGGVVSPAEPADLGGSQLSLWLDEELLEIISVSDQGRFDIERTFGGEQVGRERSLRLRFDASLEGCGLAELYHLQLDDGSWIKPHTGQGLPPGLDRFPQVAARGLRVLPGREMWELALTAEMVTIMQEASATRLPLSVIDPGDVFEQTTPLLVANPDVELQEALGTPTNPRLGRLESGGVTIQADDRLELPMTLQGFIGTDNVDVAMIESKPHGGRGGLPEPLASRGLGLLTGTNVSFGEQHDVMVAGVQQTRDAEQGGQLLPSTDVAATSDRSGSARSAFATGLLLALAGGVVVLATRPLRRRRLNG